ncbi:hypothetical protein [Actinospongicola halichondriae]|uniref:hypothetical protein n=1 Tax=Actinospongicola halichondriae TaxID=3236844 RepID=UPI003D484D88
MKRVGALLGAVVMVVAALAARGTFSDDGGSAAADDAGGLVCPTEFRPICQAGGGGRVERAGITADALVADEVTLEDEVWIVPAAWARLVIDERARLGLDPVFEIDGSPLASSRVVLAIWTSRSEQLTDACGRSVDWTCIASQDGTTLAEGDRVRSAAPPVDSATGLSVAAAQAANLLGRGDFAANDFDGTFNSLASRLAGGQQDDPITTMRTQGPGRITATGAVAADTTNLSTNFGTITPTIDIDPAVRVDVVALVRSGTSLGDDARAALQTALTEAGWALPESGPDGLPAGGVLAALRTFWNENR